MTKFIQDLRNYALHKGMPPIEHSFSMNNLNGTGFESSMTYRISRTELLKYDKMTSLSREFVSKSPLLENIKELVNAYFNEIKNFYEEFNRTLVEFHREGLLRLQQLKAEFTRSIPPDVIERFEHGT